MTWALRSCSISKLSVQMMCVIELWLRLSHLSGCNFCADPNLQLVTADHRVGSGMLDFNMPITFVLRGDKPLLAVGEVDVRQMSVQPTAVWSVLVAAPPVYI